MQSTEHTPKRMSESGENTLSAGIDVAIPCYQYGCYLRDCVASVLSQGLRNVRVLIIDNASTDNSLEVAQQLTAEDSRVEIVAHRHNLGQHASYNEAIDWARSKYFVMLDADDLLTPGSLGRAVTIMERHSDVGLAYGDAALIGSQDLMPILNSTLRNDSWRMLAGKTFLKRLCRTAQCHIRKGATVAVRTDVQKLGGYYRRELPHSDDLELWMRLARLAAVAETDAVQGIFREHEASRYVVARQQRTQQRTDHAPLDLQQDIAAFESFFSHEGALLPEAARLRGLARRSLGARAYWSALAHLCRGRPAISWELLQLAVKLCPTTAILSPVTYLFRREDTIRRIVSVASEVIAWPRPSAKAARIGG